MKIGLIVEFWFFWIGYVESYLRIVEDDYLIVLLKLVDVFVYLVGKLWIFNCNVIFSFWIILFLFKFFLVLFVFGLDSFLI